MFAVLNVKFVLFVLFFWPNINDRNGHPFYLFLVIFIPFFKIMVENAAHMFIYLFIYSSVRIIQITCQTPKYCPPLCLSFTK